MEEYTLKNLNTKFIGKKFEYYKNLESTHILAKEKPEEEIENGMVILAENQTSGIGTHGRKWFVEKGKNLTFDIILIPNCDIKKINNLTVVIAECIVKTLKELYNIETKIKMPNDIILNNKKLAGILTESSVLGNYVKKIFIGIGININQEFFENQIVNIATSLKKEFKINFDKCEILKRFLEIFEERYLNLIK